MYLFSVHILLTTTELHAFERLCICLPTSWRYRKCTVLFLLLLLSVYISLFPV